MSDNDSDGPGHNLDRSAARSAIEKFIEQDQERVKVMQRLVKPHGDALRVMQDLIAPQTEALREFHRAIAPLAEAELAYKRMMAPLEAAQRQWQMAMGPESSFGKVVVLAKSQALIAQEAIAAAGRFSSIQAEVARYDGVFARYQPHKGQEELLRRYEAGNELLRRVDAGRELTERFRVEAAWPQSFVAAITSIETQRWSVDSQLSVLPGLEHVARLKEASQSPDPFSEVVGEIIAEELGTGPGDTPAGSDQNTDQNAVNHGMRAEFLLIRPDAVVPALQSVGFKFEFTSTSLPTAIDGADPQAAFDPENSRILWELEQQLRRLIAQSLSARYGENWPDARTSQSMLRRWKKGQQRSRDERGQVLPLIYYADFMDLREIIVDEEHWKGVFEVVFRRQQDIDESFRRLQPVRNAIAHNRPLSRYDVLALWAEAARLLRAIEDLR